MDRQIREAAERGEFDNLLGAGKPLRNLSGPEDEQWWIKDWVRRENVSPDALLPLPLLLRREVEHLPETVRGLRSEETVREAVAELNRRILDYLLTPSGPPVSIRRVDAERIVAAWRAEREATAHEAAPATAATSPGPAVVGPPRPARHPWWRRIARRPGQ